MAKPKIDFKKLLLEKGEKIGIISCLVVMVLLFVWAGVAISGARSTDGLVKDLADRHVAIKNAINSPSGDPPPIDPSILGKVEYPPLASHPTSYFIDLDL